MDSSNKLNFILEGFTVPASEIEASEWLEITKAALAICKPYLKYFPRLRPISERLNCCLGNYHDRETDEAIAEFPKGITQKTDCLEIDQLIHQTEGIHSDHQFGVRFVILQTLLLSRKGKWINWHYKFERKARYGLGFRGHRTGILEVAKICKFSLVQEDRLLGLLEEKSNLGQRILDILYSLAIEGVRERQRRLQQIEQAKEQLAGIKSRIDEVL